ncbi:GH23547 [Drosophila grimshawi]|uniref:GH23547 n=1 Tax=Drosophila grimshawi TaxID=7222 RepID=B4K2P5_DROGR|nr:GH23547 [Drosophila grimshawi]
MCNTLSQPKTALKIFIEFVAVRPNRKRVRERERIGYEGHIGWMSIQAQWLSSMMMNGVCAESSSCSLLLSL